MKSSGVMRDLVESRPCVCVWEKVVPVTFSRMIVGENVPGTPDRVQPYEHHPEHRISKKKGMYKTNRVENEVTGFYLTMLNFFAKTVLEIYGWAVLLN